MIAVVNEQPGHEDDETGQGGDEYRDRSDEPRQADRRRAEQEGGERLEDAADAGVALRVQREEAQSEPEHGSDDDLVPTAAEKLTDRAGQYAEGERDDGRTVWRRGRHDALDVRHPLARGNASVRDVERDLLECGELGEVHLARLDAKQMRVLPRLGTERRHDLRRHREEAMPVEAEPVRRGAEDPFEARRGVAVGVQGAGELEHETDGERIGLAEVQLGRRPENVFSQGTRGAGTALMLLPRSRIARPNATIVVTAATPTTTAAVRPTLSFRCSIEATSVIGTARRSRGLSV